MDQLTKVILVSPFIIATNVNFFSLTFEVVIKRITRKRTASPTPNPTDSQSASEEPSVAKSLKREISQASLLDSPVQDSDHIQAVTPSFPSPIEASIEAVVTSVVIKEEKDREDSEKNVRHKHQGRGRPPKTNKKASPPEIESNPIGE